MFAWFILLIFLPITYYCYLYFFYLYCLQKIKQQRSIDTNITIGYKYTYKFILHGIIPLLRTQHKILKGKCNFRQILIIMLDFHHRFFVSLNILFSCLKIYNTKTQKNSALLLFSCTGCKLIKFRSIQGISWFYSKYKNNKEE